MAQQLLMGQVLLIIEASRSHSLRQTTLGRTPLYESSARRRGLYLTTHNTHNRQTSMPPVGFFLILSVFQNYSFTRIAVPGLREGSRYCVKASIYMYIYVCVYIYRPILVRELSVT
jgi:hypothetical protein